MLDVAVKGRWTNQDLPEQKNNHFYINHGLSEQFLGKVQIDLTFRNFANRKTAINYGAK